MSYIVYLKATSTENKVPTLDNLDFGEVLLNRNTNSPALFIRVGTGEDESPTLDKIVKIGPTYIGATYPNSVGGIGPFRAETWYNDSTNVLNYYTGTQWKPVNKGLYYQPTEPAAKSVGDMWIDSDSSSPYLSVWNGTTWLSILEIAPVQNVKELGAIGNGNADNATADTTAIQAAINAAAASAVQNDVVIPAGTYYINAPLYIPQLTDKGLRVIGAGNETILKFHPTFPVSSTYFDLSGTSKTIQPAMFQSLLDQRSSISNVKPLYNLVFEDFQVDGEELELAGGNSHVFLMNGLFEGCEFNNIKGNAINYFLRLCTSRNVKIKGCDLFSNVGFTNTAITLGDILDTQGLASGPSLSAVLLEIEGSDIYRRNLVQNIKIEECSFSTFGNAIKARVVNNLEVDNNYFYNCPTAIVLYQGVDIAKITNNHFKDCNSHNISLRQGLILGLEENNWYQPPRFVNVNGCVFQNSVLWLESGESYIIENNDFFYVRDTDSYSGTIRISGSPGVLRNVTINTHSEAYLLGKANLFGRVAARNNTLNGVNEALAKVKDNSYKYVTLTLANSLYQANDLTYFLCDISGLAASAQDLLIAAPVNPVIGSKFVVHIIEDGSYSDTDNPGVVVYFTKTLLNGSDYSGSDWFNLKLKTRNAVEFLYLGSTYGWLTKELDLAIPTLTAIAQESSTPIPNTRSTALDIQSFSGVTFLNTNINNWSMIATSTYSVSSSTAVVLSILNSTNEISQLAISDDNVPIGIGSSKFVKFRLDFVGVFNLNNIKLMFNFNSVTAITICGLGAADSNYVSPTASSVLYHSNVLPNTDTFEADLLNVTGFNTTRASYILQLTGGAAVRPANIIIRSIVFRGGIVA